VRLHQSKQTDAQKRRIIQIYGEISGLVLRCVEPIWKSKPETASRLRGRIERILGWATVKGFRDDIPNPARWLNNLDHLLPGKGAIHKVTHHAALPYAELPAFMTRLRQDRNTGARALEFVILGAVRTGDVIGQRRADGPPMLWSHVDRAARLWTIPRTKNGSEHRVPLSDAALAVLDRMQPLRGASDIVFEGQSRGQPLSDGTMLAVLRRIGHGNLTTHGFRATFKTWAAEQTNYAHEIVEACLTHTIADKLERAYRRGDFLHRRALLMRDWAAFCNGRAVPQEPSVVALHG
jgi:integrase